MLPTQCLPNHHTLTPKRAQNGVVVEPELLADGDARESPAVELNSPRYIHKLHPSGRVDSTRSQVLRDRCSAHPELAGDLPHVAKLAVPGDQQVDLVFAQLLGRPNRGGHIVCHSSRPSGFRDQLQG